jgi:ribosomal protein S18 acetylase RimI-like enzyme
MRPGRAADLPGVLELWRNDVRTGSGDNVPGDEHIRRLTAAFQWDGQSRVVDRDGGLEGALALSHIEFHREDPRAQPVGTISSVGTLPEHRRRGLATWLVAETLLRLHRGGARSAPLYVDGKSPFRAYDAYSKLGFKVAFESEVWEATFR